MDPSISSRRRNATRSPKWPTARRYTRLRLGLDTGKQQGSARICSFIRLINFGGCRREGVTAGFYDTRREFTANFQQYSQLGLNGLAQIVTARSSIPSLLLRVPQKFTAKFEIMYPRLLFTKRHDDELDSGQRKRTIWISLIIFLKNCIYRENFFTILLGRLDVPFLNFYLSWFPLNPFTPSSCDESGKKKKRKKTLVFFPNECTSC